MIQTPEEARLELARQFMRIAFAGNSPSGHYGRRIVAMAPDTFEPSPLYLEQADACIANRELRESLVMMLESLPLSAQES